MSRQRGHRLQLQFLKNFDWWERAYIIDWSAVILIFGFTFLVKQLPVFERDFDPTGADTVITHAFRKEERVPGSLLHAFAFYIPLLIAILTGVMKGSSHDLHHAVIALCAGAATTDLVVQFLKNRIGRLRPDFLSRCGWDVVLATCTGPQSRVLDGRRSFPSGHSASSFAGLGFVFLLIAGQFGSSSSRPSSLSQKRASLWHSRLLRMTITVIPLILALWVAITRLEDYRHHAEDVIVGGILGFSITRVCYNIYWPSPFRNASKPSSAYDISQPRILYRADDNLTRADGFELTGMDDEDDEIERAAEEGRLDGANGAPANAGHDSSIQGNESQNKNQG